MSRGSPADWSTLRLVDAPVWFGRHHLGALLGVVVPARILAVVPSTLGQVLAWETGNEAGASQVVGLAITYGGLFFSSLVLTVMYGALAHAVVHRLEGRAPTASESWRFGLRPAVAATSLLVGAMTLVGSMMCAVPGLLIAMYFSLVLPVMVAEGPVLGAAMDRSMALARHGRRGPWFTSTGALCLVLTFTYAMISYAINSLVTVPAAAMGAVIGVRAAMEGADIQSALASLPPSVTVVLNLGGALLGGFADIYLLGALALLYRRARDLVEGLDLLEALEGDVPAGTPS